MPFDDDNAQQPNSKRCTSCGEVKLLTEFYTAKKGKFGRRSECISCFKERQKILDNKDNESDSES